MVWKRLHERVRRMVQGVVADEDETFLVQIDGPGTVARPVRVLDLVDPREPRADTPTRHARMVECRACDRFTSNVCRECGCVMVFKTWLANSECPLGKWGKVDA